MSAATLAVEQVAYRARTRWSMSASFILHALLLLWIVFAPHAVSQAPALTEITLLEPGEPAAASAAAALAASATPRSGAAVQSDLERSFRRVTTRAEITPEPESPDAIDDRIAARLAALQTQAPAPVRGAALSAPASLAWGSPAPAGVGTGGGRGLELTRGGTGTGQGPALSLHREGTGFAPALAPAGLPAGVASAAAAPARSSETTARRQIAGAMLAGPIADRPVVTWARPIYPEWAKRDAVEGSVTLYFIVRPDGGVMENVLVQKTAGFEDFDESARAALKAWRFAPLGAGRTGDQWGTITFHFRLTEAG